MAGNNLLLAVGIPTGLHFPKKKVGKNTTTLQRPAVLPKPPQLYVEPLFGRSFRKYNNLDFIRFVLAILVIYCHCHVIYFGTEETVEPLWVLSNRQMSLGTLAVNFFFVVSGFLIYQSWENSPTLLAFLKKRVLRIYPAFAVVSLLCVFVVGPFSTSDFFQPWGYWTSYYAKIDYSKLIINILLLKETQVPWSFINLPMHNVINGSLWTIRYEFVCYLLVGFLGAAGLLKRKWFAWALFLVACGLYSMQEWYHIWLYNWQETSILGKPDFYPRFTMYFVCGILFYQNRKTIPRLRSLFFLSIFICLLSACYFKGLMYTLPSFGAYALFYIAFSRQVRLYRWARFGDFSYGIYLYAWPLQQLLLLFFEPSMNVWNLFSMATLVSVLMAFLSWNLVEKPFLQLKQTSLK